MMSQRARTGLVLAALLLPLNIVVASEGADDILGQVTTGQVQLDGVFAPPGTALFDPSSISTGLHTGTIHLEDGRVIALGKNSSISLEGTEDGAVQMAVLSGRVAYQSASGDIMSVGKSGSVRFEQQGEIGEGRRVVQESGALVARLAASAGEGSSVLPVDDVGNISEADPQVIVRSQDGEVQQNVCLKGVKDAKVKLASNGQRQKGPEVNLADRLYAGFASEDLVLQGESSDVPGQGKGEVGELEDDVAGGDDIVPIDDVAKIDPWKKVLIRGEDGKQDIACLKAVIGAGAGDRDPRGGDDAPYLALRKGLQNSYSSGAMVIQGAAPGGGEGVVTELVEPVDGGSDTLRIADDSRLDPLGFVLLRSSDGTKQEVHCISSTDGLAITLGDSLDNAFGIGTEIVQGREVADALLTGAAIDRTDSCHCCGPSGAGALVAWWTTGKVVAAVLGLGAVRYWIEDDQEVRDPSPILP